MRHGRCYSAPSCHLGTEHPRDLFRIARLRGPAVPAAAPPEGESSAAGALSSGPPPGGAGDFKSARGNSTNFGPDSWPRRASPQTVAHGRPISAANLSNAEGLHPSKT